MKVPLKFPVAPIVAAATVVKPPLQAIPDLNCSSTDPPAGIAGSDEFWRDTTPENGTPACAEVSGVEIALRLVFVATFVAAAVYGPTNGPPLPIGAEPAG